MDIAFHGGDTGSNPVGVAIFNDLPETSRGYVLRLRNKESPLLELCFVPAESRDADDCARRIMQDQAAGLALWHWSEAPGPPTSPRFSFTARNARVQWKELLHNDSFSTPVVGGSWRIDWPWTNRDA